MQLVFAPKLGQELVLSLSFFSVSKVFQLATKHLSAQSKLDPRRRFRCFWHPKNTWTPPFSASNTLTIVENILEMRKLRPPKVKGVKNFKKQTTKHYKANSWTHKKFLVCCCIVIRVERWFIELEAVLL